jgi:hypothetical protein
MVALAQLTAADFPEIAFPPGTDLLQIPWCVGYHGGVPCLPDGRRAADVQQIWRRAMDVTEVLTDPPVPDLTDELPGFYETYIPRPCILHPERIIEYPYRDELPADLQDRVKALDPNPDFYDDLAVAPGIKLGGIAYGHVNERCNSCGTPGVLFLQLGNFELDDRWVTVEERHLVTGTPEYEDADSPTGMMRDVGTGGLFTCPTNPDHGLSYHSQ